MRKQIGAIRSPVQGGAVNLRSRAQLLRCLATLLAFACWLPAHGAIRPLTFEHAADKATILKGCPKRARGSIESVYLSDAEGNPWSVSSGKPPFLVVQAAEATDFLVIGPLLSPPTSGQLQSLRGRPTCVISG
jgi:hypothetical protein